MHVCNPLLVLSPHLDHSGLGLFARIEDSDGTIAIAGAKDIAGDLIRGQRCDTGAGASRDILIDLLAGAVVGKQVESTFVQISVAAFHTRMTLTSPATRSLPCPCCQSRTRPAFFVLGTRSVSARKAVTSSTFFSDS